jgi:hypothetical protein
MRRLAVLIVALGILIAACGPGAAAAPAALSSPPQAEVGALATLTATAVPPEPGEPTSAPSVAAPTATSTAAPSAPASYGPDDFPSGINPLTGLPAADPSLLDLPAVLVSVTNFPVSARPQAGLSFAAMVYEIFISEGTTRYLAVFYGDHPKAAADGASGEFVDKVGPVRSGRLPYAYVRDAFQWSCLVYASAAEQLRARLRGCDIVYGDDANDINSAFLDVTKLKALAQENAKPDQPFNYTGNLFSETAPGSGEPAEALRVFYSYLNQTRWTYDPASGKYLRSQNSPAAPQEFTADTDRLTGEQLAYSNVVVLFAKHDAVAPTIIDIDLGTGTGGYAYLFRDGQAFPIQWTTVGGDYEKATGLRRPIRFLDESGSPIALNPGSTWVHVVTPYSTVSEESAAEWLARFYAPAGSR